MKLYISRAEKVAFYISLFSKVKIIDDSQKECMLKGLHDNIRS